MMYSTKQVQMFNGGIPSTKKHHPAKFYFADNRPVVISQRKILDGVQDDTTCIQGTFQVIQRMLTRQTLKKWVDWIIRGHPDVDQFKEMPDEDQYLILSVVRDKSGAIYNAFSELMQGGDVAAEENSDIDHPDLVGAQEYTEEQLAQMKRGPGLSGPKDTPFMSKAYYRRDLYGNIDFSSVEKLDPDGKWKDPVLPGSQVNLEMNGKKSGYGLLSNGNYVCIADASRQQHFSIANRVARENGKTHSQNPATSPDGFTWHHLIDKYKMVLVDRETHRRFGHNGGFYFWH